MKTELQKQLLTKYPEFFSHTKKKIYVGEKSMKEEVGELLAQKEIVEPIQFGFEIGDGWYTLLDELMGNIKWHLENENRNLANKFKYKWMWTLQAYIRRKHYKKEKLKALAEWIYEHAPRQKFEPIIVSVTQIKEKFGELCFYYYGGDDTISGMVYLTQSLSNHICEYCGTTINVGKTRGWLSTICKNCHAKIENRKNLTWIPNNDISVLTTKDLRDIDLANEERGLA
ncbi:MAG: hypothetical protein WC554_14205 [Clostridia bacterium]